LATDQVIAVCLCGPEAPPLVLRPRGTGEAAGVTLRVGMTKEQLEQAHAELANNYTFAELAVPGVWYRCYLGLGVALRFPLGHDPATQPGENRNPPGPPPKTQYAPSHPSFQKKKKTPPGFLPANLPRHWTGLVVPLPVFSHLSPDRENAAAPAGL